MAISLNTWSQLAKIPIKPATQLPNPTKSSTVPNEKRKTISGRYIVVYKDQSSAVSRQITVTDSKERNRLLRQDINTTLQKHQLYQKPLSKVYDSALKGFVIDGLNNQEVERLRQDDQIASIEPDFKMYLDRPKTQAINADDSPTCELFSVVTNSGENFNVGNAKFGGFESVTAEAIVISSLGCETIPDPDLAIKDKIVIIDRGDCNFSTKAYQAQLAEAVGVIIVNNKSGNSVISMGIGDNSQLVNIPVLMISKEKGDELKAALILGSVSVTLHPNKLSIQECTPWGITRVNGGVANAGSGKRAWVIDTGIDLDHPDLDIDLGLSRNFATDGNSADDMAGHGTHVAGTIAAKVNGLGVIGVSPGAKVVAIRIFDADESTTYSGLLDAMNYVYSTITNSDDVINMSFGSYGYLSKTYEDVVKKLATKAHVVISAGNSFGNTNFYDQARIKASKIYIVSSITKNNDSFSIFSNYGTSVTYAAPGSDIISCAPGGGYQYMSGTSMAAPHVAGMLLAGGMYISGSAKNDPDGRPDPIPALNCDNSVNNDGDPSSTCDGDPDDNDPTVYPGAPEICDGKDNDGDGLVDEDNACWTSANGTIVYVKQNATGANNGTSWSNAFTELSSALLLARKSPTITQVWVAQGTYTPKTDELGISNLLDPRLKTFTLRSNLAVYGSLQGNEPENFDMMQRNIGNHPTYLSGEIQDDDNLENNAYNIIRNYPDYGQSIDNTAIVSGLYTYGGMALSLDPDDYIDFVKSQGGGILNIDSSPTYHNSIIFNNAAYYGGGIYNLNSGSSFTNSYVLANEVADMGSAMYNENSTIESINNSFQSNLAYNLFSGIGGTVVNDNSNTIFNGNTITGNESQGGGNGGIVQSGTTYNHVISNSILWENTGNSLVNLSGSTSLNYSIIANWTGDGSNNVFQDPMFVDQPNYTDNIVGNIALLPCSPGINKGDPSATAAQLGNYDLDLLPRFHNTIADIGATEYQADPMKVTITSSVEGKVNSGDAVTLTAAGATTYLWSNTETTPSIVVNPSSDSTFIVQGSISSGLSTCMLEDSITLLINPLPVRLISFAVQPHLNNVVKIEWTTTNELNNNYFEIERSSDLINSKVIAQVQATSSTSKGIHQYTQVDESPYKGRNYYRLVQVDKDGTTTRYDWKSVVLDQEYMVYPNPVTTGNFSVQLDEGQYSQLRLTNTEGNNIPFTTHRANGQIQIQLPKGITPGLYQLKVQERGQSTIHKVIVQ